MSVQMIIRIDSDMKRKLTKLARLEGKSTSKIVREIIEDFINERDIEKYIDRLWDRIGKQLRTKKVKPTDVKKAIREARKMQR